MFQGFTDRTFEFFMAIRFNNNREFFLPNREWYETAVRDPMRALAAELAPCVEALDPSLERRPDKVVSRINRDVRFSNDKSPYRDYIWMAFRRPGEERQTTLGVYFDLSDGGASYGMGYYLENRPIMNALRRRLITEPESFLAVMRPAMEGFQLHASVVRRIKPPEDMAEELRPWYPLKGFYIERDINDMVLLKSPALVNEITGGFQQIAPLYRYILALAPEEDIT